MENRAYLPQPGSLTLGYPAVFSEDEIHFGAGNADWKDVPPPRSEPSRPERRPGAYPGLAALLWTVRDTLEAVLYRLIVVRLVLTDGSPRWLPRADADLQDALEALRSVEVLRAAEVDGIVHAGRKPERGSLAALIKIAPEPWPKVFAEHRDALRLLVTEVEAATAENKRLLLAAGRRRRMPATCATHPVRDDTAATAAAAYRSALATLATLPQLSLQEFLT